MFDTWSSARKMTTGRCGKFQENYGNNSKKLEILYFVTYGLDPKKSPREGLESFVKTI